VTDHLRIAPFAGIRYNAEKVPDLSKVVAPPYDMISQEEQAELYDRHPMNVVRLILARKGEGGSSPDRYQQSAATYSRWKEERVLVRDEEPAIYAYRQDYEWAGRSLQRLGFIARVALTEFGEGAFPHESTLSGPKADRLNLLTACRANFSSIFSLFSDAEGRIQDRLQAETASPPQVELEDDRGVGHRLWRLSRPEFHSWINEQMRDKQFIIADGHHRYETALEYRRRMRKDPGGFKGDYDYVMMFLAPIESPDLTILPFHRLLDVEGTGDVMAKLAQAFDITELPIPEKAEEAQDRVKGFLDAQDGDVPALAVYRGGDACYGLRMKADFDPAPMIRPGTSPQVAALDVTILHQVIFSGLLGLDEPRLLQGGGISFLSRAEDAFVKAESNGNRVVFFLRPTRKEQVWDIAVSGQKMPQKSTNFHPKLITGLVINEL
jgi:uncharacterized protein (DUF1015 family)